MLSNIGLKFATISFALAAPFPQIKFIPTGGVNKDNLDEFLEWEKVYAVGGSFIVEEALKNE